MTDEKVTRAQFNEIHLEKYYRGLKEDGACGQTVA